ncbi:MULTISPECIES: DUF6907 domain-containing protein [unclassified Streptomyces]|uniref:DUF6907 domain-containing protein n=1 Tax=unclassified Streptomyces TaxID=2593676 RepID=UPI0036E84CF3
MTEPRTVTLTTIDHGSVTLAEPAWCAGHAGHLPGYRVDLSHTGARRSFAFGAATLMVAMLTQDPCATDPGRRGTALHVELPWYADTLDSGGVRQLAATLTVHAMYLRQLADELGALEAAEEEAQ